MLRYGMIVTFRDWTFGSIERIIRSWPAQSAQMALTGDYAMTVHQISELDAFRARIAEQDKIIAALKAQSDRKLSCKVTDKGGVSVYGLGRFPVTLYASQWDKLLAGADMVRAFLTANRALLSTKD